MKLFHNFTKYLLAFLFFIPLPISIAAHAFSGETYVFERMWPTVNQDWYFYLPFCVAVDSEGYVYVLEYYGHRVVKLNSNGNFITEWGRKGSENGEFSYPYGIAIDNMGYICVSDTRNHRIQKFTSDGQFISTMGSYGSSPGKFNDPRGIEFDSSNNIYVVDSGNHRIQKFNSEWEYITEWGSEGSGDGQFLTPTFIAIDSADNVYIGEQHCAADDYPWSNCDIQKFTSEGQFILRWGPSEALYEGNKDYDFSSGVAVDHNDYVYVLWENIEKYSSDGQFITSYERAPGSNNITLAQDCFYLSGSRVVKYSSNGNILDYWAASGGDEDVEKFGDARSLTRDSNGDIYVADSLWIDKFSSDGEWINTWMAREDNYAGMTYPMDVTVHEDRVYVSVEEFYGDNHIQVWTTSGQWIKRFGSGGSGNGEFDSPRGISTDYNGNVYVADFENHRIQKFDSEGDYLKQWGALGSGNGEFNYPWGIAVDSDANVYVTDTFNHRIQKFNSDGIFLKTWGSHGTEGGKFNQPLDIEVDNSNNIYVVEFDGNRVQKFTSEGEFITKYGSWGTSPGQMRNPMGIAVDPEGDKIYISDNGNNRVQVFNKISIFSNSKAIILAGGGSFPGNNLWNATQMNANFAYRALTYQGFTKNNIYYISSDTDLDLDLNGEADDVDADATNANLEHAITTWAADADSLILYLVDHGGDGTFRMSETDMLLASDLDNWLDQLQETIPGKVTVIYDACESGSFISQLTPPSGKERIVISSASPGESAHFVTQGSVSFSNYFWTHIFNGFNIKNAFDLAEEAIGFTTDNQHPLLDDNGNGIGNEEGDGLLAENTFIGNGTVIQGDSPVIGSVFDPLTITDTNSTLLYASDVTDNDGIARVWAVIRPPYYYQQSSDNPVYSLPSIDLMPVGDDRYEATYDGFYLEGTYTIAIYARDRVGNTAVPELTTVSVNNPLSRKAIIVGGSWQADSLWPAVERNVAFAYNVLRYQGYSDADIYLLSPSPIDGTEVDGDTTLSNLSYAINVWAQQGTQDVLLYMIVNGNHKCFRINQTEDISATELDTLLDNLQDNIPGKVTVVYDACRSGSFLEELTPPEGKERILISSSSSDEPAHFLSEGDICFSRFFWANIANGADVYDAFVVAKDAIMFSCMGQTPQMDDNGNGISNEKQDGLLSRYYSIGVGIMLAGDAPVIGSACPNQTLSGTSSGTIWVDNVTSTGDIELVWAVITPPGYLINVAGRPVIDLPIMELVDEGNGLYEGTYSDFNTCGVYNIAVYAKDVDGNISIPMETKIFQEEGLGAWNLISLEKQPENGNIEAVLDSISDKVISVWAYIDGSWQVYDPENPGFSDLTTMEAGKGYWINMFESATLTISGSTPLNSVEISSGWNLVGYNSSTAQDIADALESIDGNYISVWAYIDGGWLVYDPENPGVSDLLTMEPGYGYWINVREECTWTLP
jgi:DNA-binding beta-propeller fold protein YncE